MTKIEITTEENGLSSTLFKKDGKIIRLHEMNPEELDKLSAAIYGALRLIEITMRNQ